MTNVIIEDSRWDNVSIDFDLIVSKIRDHLKVKDSEETGFSLLMTGDDDIQTFNAAYRAKDKPTNVLSFPCTDIKGYIGDMILSYDTVEREASEQKKAIQDHSIHMIIHGFLHLLGFDHIHDDEAEIMEGHEIAILSSLNIKNPYDN
ncbi:MAG: rRNA maturation RNase YbeY [Bdellovibrionales bacterium]